MSQAPPTLLMLGASAIGFQLDVKCAAVHEVIHADP